MFSAFHRFVFLSLSAGWVLAQDASLPVVHDSVGQELNELQVEDARRNPLDQLATSAAASGLGDGAVLKRLQEGLVQVPEGADGSISIRSLTFVGDEGFLRDLGLLQPIRYVLLEQPASEDRLTELLERCRKEFVEQGYYLASLRILNLDAATGDLLLQVDPGRVGRLAYYSLDGDYWEASPDERLRLRGPYKGWFRESQFNKRLGLHAPGATFNYQNLHASLLKINSMPDVTMHAELKVRSEQVDETTIRYLDTELYIEDRIPLHGAIELKNTGTADTEDFRISLKLQYLNLTKNDDTLTLAVPVSVDFTSVRSFSGSYIRPLEIGRGAGLSVFGGYSKLVLDEVLPSFDLNGKGWFFGPRAFYHLSYTEDHVINAVFGGLYRSLSDTISFQGQAVESAQVDVLPLTFGLTYTSVRPDALGGRSFANALVSHNVLGDAFGVTDEVALITQRDGARADYWNLNLGLTRIQSIRGKLDPATGLRAGEWYYYLFLDTQYTTDTLVPGDQKAVGGFESVRGYPERSVAGDWGGYLRQEIRSPIWQGFLSRRFQKAARRGDTAYVPWDYFQLLAFVDLGYVENNEAIEGVDDRISLASVGPGVRLSLTRQAQLKLDYGIPLSDVEGVSRSGKFHLALEIQF